MIIGYPHIRQQEPCNVPLRMFICPHYKCTLFKGIYLQKCPKMEEAVDVCTGSLHLSHASCASPERVIMGFREFDMRTLRQEDLVHLIIIKHNWLWIQHSLCQNQGSLKPWQSPRVLFSEDWLLSQRATQNGWCLHKASTGCCSLCVRGRSPGSLGKVDSVFITTLILMFYVSSNRQSSRCQLHQLRNNAPSTIGRSLKRCGCSLIKLYLLSLQPQGPRNTCIFHLYDHYS